MKDIKHYQKLRYPIRIEPDPEGGYLASHPDLPGCFAFGETLQGALESLAESREMWLETYFQSHGEAPEPSKPRKFSGKFVVRMSKYLHEKLHESAEEEGVSLNSYVVTLLAEHSERRCRYRFESLQSSFSATTSETLATLLLAKTLSRPVNVKCSEPTRSNWLFGDWKNLATSFESLTQTLTESHLETDKEGLQCLYQNK